MVQARACKAPYTGSIPVAASHLYPARLRLAPEGGWPFLLHVAGKAGDCTAARSYDARVRHITPARLDGIEPLLGSLRDVDGLVERNRGVFYRRSRAFLHFHEDGDDVYADVRLDGDDFERLRATTRSEQRALVSRVRACLRGSASQQ